MHRSIGLALLALLGTFVAWTAITATQRPPALAAASCLHEDDPTDANRARRDEALALARALNAAQGRAAERTQLYQPLATLETLPPTPDGFDLRFYTDGAGYIFSVKDSRDPCHYGIFSDQHGRLYEATPQRPQIAS